MNQSIGAIVAGVLALGLLAALDDDSDKNIAEIQNRVHQLSEPVEFLNAQETTNGGEMCYMMTVGVRCFSLVDGELEVTE